MFKKIALLITFLFALSLPAQAQSSSLAVGMWLSQSELDGLPTSGAAWNALLAAANTSAGTPDLSNQDSNNDVYVLAKALVYSKTGETKYRDAVLAALKQVPQTENGGRTLALGRNLVSYVIAADLINLPSSDPSFDVTFRTWLSGVRTKTLDGRTLISTHEDRPNNWGTHAGASRVAADLYLGDRTDLDRASKVFHGWLGDRSAYSGFTYGPLDWQCNPSAPVGINPTGCTIQGINVGGSQPEEMRRSGGFQNPPVYTGYAWEALQGAFVQAILLERAGYPALEWNDKALLRAVDYLTSLGWNAVGDDLFQPWLINYAYSIGLQTSTAGHGKNMGWTDWTHGGRRIGTVPTQTPTPTNTPTSTATPTLTVTPTATQTNIPTETPTLTPTASIVPTEETPTAVISPTVTPGTICLIIVLEDPPSVHFCP